MDKIPNIDNPKWKENVPIYIDYLGILIIVANIQLALRHPKNKGPSAKIARNLGWQLAIRLLAEFDIPKDVVKEWEKEFGKLRE